MLITLRVIRIGGNCNSATYTYLYRKELQMLVETDIIGSDGLKIVPQPSCLDSAYERLAIDQGMNSNPVFPENILYLEYKMLKEQT